MTSFGIKIFVAGLLFLGYSGICRAQFAKASIGVNGLTCSQCSRSVEVELRKLDFIRNVSMDLEHTQGTILFKDKAKVNIAAIAKAVKNAGFSVRFLKAELDVTLAAPENQCLKYRGDTYFLLKPLGNKETATLQFIGKEYMPGKELKRYTLPSKIPCRGTLVYYADVL